MTFPEWTKPGIYGALGGAIAISIVGFIWGGWTTSGKAPGSEAPDRDLANACLAGLELNGS